MEKSGSNSGSLARVIPVLAYDRELVRLQHERLPSKSFSFDGLKEALGILENKFCNQTSVDEVPALTLEFSTSTLMNQFRSTNNLLTETFRGEHETNINGILTALLNNSPPNTDSLQEEGSGVGQIEVFLAQSEAEFRSAEGHPGDDAIVAGLPANLLRVASDYF